jgi:hypothetical protein
MEDPISHRADAARQGAVEAGNIIVQRATFIYLFI